MRPLLCELHAHTDRSDGELTLAQLVDTYGNAGFDVLCVTDHVHPPGDPWSHLGLEPVAIPAYVAEIEREALRARARYDLLLVPGFELTDNQPEPDLAAHALALGVRSSLPLSSGIAPAIAAARDSGGAVIAAHPSGPEGVDQRATRRLLARAEPLPATWSTAGS